MFEDLETELFGLLKSFPFKLKIPTKHPLLGKHFSPKTGHSPEFLEYDTFLDQEDPRQIDWRVSAKSGRKVKRKEEHQGLVQHWFWLDGSASMLFPNERHSKYRRQCLLTAALMHMAREQGDAVGLIIQAERILSFYEPKKSQEALSEIIAHLSSSKARGTFEATPPPGLLDHLSKRPSIIWKMTDLDGPLEPHQNLLTQLSTQHDLRLVHLYHPSEKDLSWHSLCRFEDLEEQFTELKFDPRDLSKRYQDYYNQHIESTLRFCKKNNISFYQHDISSSVLDFFKRLNHV